MQSWLAERLFRCTCANTEDELNFRTDVNQSRCVHACDDSADGDKKQCDGFTEEEEDGDKKQCGGCTQREEDLLLDTMGLDEIDTPAVTGGLGTPKPVKAPSISLEEEVMAFIDEHCDLMERKGWDIEHLHEDQYSINDRNVKLLLLPPSEALRMDFTHLAQLRVPASAVQKAQTVMVRDGPLRQPLMDYMMQTGVNEFYDTEGTENPMAVTGAARNLDLFTPLKPLRDSMSCRLDAMQIATVEANVRHKVAATERGMDMQNPNSVTLKMSSQRQKDATTEREADIQKQQSIPVQMLRIGPSRFSRGMPHATIGGA